MIFVKFNEDGTYGFYTPEIHGEEIIEDKSYIPITDEAYHELINNQGLKMLGDLHEGIEEIVIDHIVEVPEQEPAPPTVRELVSQQKDLAVKLLVPTLPDEALLQIPLLVDEWAVGVDYVAHKSVVRHEDILYRVITSHHSQSDWIPPDVPALYKQIEPPNTIGPWRQPQGAHDVYQKGDKVTHKNKTWQSDVDGNVWEPGVNGWTEVDE